MRPRIFALVFASGFCALVYQSVWMRLFRLIFGASTAANAAVLAIFMAGLGLGSIWLGRKADSHKQPLVLYGWIELGIALGAAMSPLLVELARAVYFQLGGTAALGGGLGTGVRMALALLVLAVPTFLMGGTLPALARSLQDAQDLGRREVGSLYAINTFGAVAGGFLSTFVLVEVFGVTSTLWLAAAINAVVGLLAIRLGGTVPPLESSAESAHTVRASQPDTRNEAGADGPAEDTHAAPPIFVIVAAAVVGFVFFAMELVWYRMLAPLLGGSSFSFGLVLVAALAGIALGGLLYGSGRQALRPTLHVFALTCALEALVVVIPYALGDNIAVLALLSRSLLVYGFWGLVASWAFVTAIVVVPAAIIAGFQFPLLIGLLGSGERQVGREVGQAYAANTAGAVLGAMASGFGLIALLGAERMWQAMSVTLILLAVVAAVLHQRGRAPLSGTAHDRATQAARNRGGSSDRRRSTMELTVPLGVGLLAAVLCFTGGPSVAARHLAIGAGRVELGKTPREVHKTLVDGRSIVFWSREGVESGIALTARSSLSLIVNGKSDGSARGDAATTIMAPLLGALLVQNPRRGLVIGLGTGESAGWLAEVPSMQHVDCVELEPAVIEVAQILAAHNFDVVNHPKVRIHVGDGREFVLTSRETYDVIMSEPSNPYRAGVASLFSQDFYRSVHDRLDDEGVFVQWLQAYEVDAMTIRTAIATLRSVFPSVEVYSLHATDLALVARKHPASIDLAQLRDRAGQSPYAEALAISWGTSGIDGILAAYLGNDGFARSIYEQDADWIDTDDQPVLEFGFGRTVGQPSVVEIADIRTTARDLGHAEPPLTGEGPTPDQIAEAANLRTLHGSGAGGHPASTASDPAVVARQRARAARAKKDYLRACAAWKEQSSPPLHFDDKLLLVECAIEGERVSPSEELLASIEKVSPTTALLLRARDSMRTPDVAATDALLVAAFTSAQTDAWFDADMLSNAILWIREHAAEDRALAARWLRLLSTPFAGQQLTLVRRSFRVELAAQVDFNAPCVEAFASLEPHLPPDLSLLRERVRCYELTAHPLLARANQDLAAYQRGAAVAFSDGLLP